MAAPADAENDPGSHFAHDAEPTDEATVPASHFEHAKDPAGAYLPGPQSVQMEAALAPTAAESLPATHSVQTVAALASEYFPAPQLSQPELPAVAEYFPASHVTHELAPSEDEYDPAGHIPQASLLRVALNVPVWQIAHVPGADAP